MARAVGLFASLVLGFLCFAEFPHQKRRRALPILNDKALDRGQLVLRRSLRRLLQLAGHQPRQLGERAPKLALGLLAAAKLSSVPRLRRPGAP